MFVSRMFENDDSVPSPQERASDLFQEAAPQATDYAGSFSIRATPRVPQVNPLEPTAAYSIPEHVNMGLEANDRGIAAMRAMGYLTEDERHAAGLDDQAPPIAYHRPQFKSRNYRWTPARTEVWNTMEMEVPEVAEAAEWHPIHSVATPTNVDIRLIGNVPLTAAEILSFFPLHYNNKHFQDRFLSAGMTGNIEVVGFINHRRAVVAPFLLHGNTYSTYKINLHNGRVPSQSKFSGPVTDLTPQSWDFSTLNHGPLDGVPIDYPLIETARGVDRALWPQGEDAGLYTSALAHAFDRGHHVMLSELERYIYEQGLSLAASTSYTNLHPDVSYKGRWSAMLRTYWVELKEGAKKLGLKYK
ncbi:hypothetical protein BDV96DRAFT_652382 [Lophiotrema nucula]|uniref:Uncharacterized protein n=1 Tax=Lophiotrema nucula TaxID=690887 RepID=A0A6A5YRQ9_9PLEO|nr:hypothetical protein BDV96DRAFT_652382 [Lophiotrema nucula]